MYPDKQTISEYFYYENGVLLNKQAPKRKRSKSNSVAGTKTEEGYIRVGFLGKNYYVHRLIWILMVGQVNDGDQIDHINGVKNDNRIENLRKVCIDGNNQNLRSAKTNSKTGVLGVVLRKDGKFEAQIRVNKVKTNLGRFSSAEVAEKAYLDAKRKLHGTCSI